MRDVSRQVVHIGILARSREDGRVFSRDRAPALAFERARHDGGAALRFPLPYEIVEERDDVFGQPHGDLLAHPTMVLIRDSIRRSKSQLAPFPLKPYARRWSSWLSMTRSTSP